jgi:hypothetical protein
VITSSHTGHAVSTWNACRRRKECHSYAIHTDGHRQASASTAVDTFVNSDSCVLCPSVRLVHTDAGGIWHLLDADDHSLDSCQVQVQVRMVVMFASMVVMPARLRSVHWMVEQSRPCQMGYSAGVRFCTHAVLPLAGLEDDCCHRGHPRVSARAHGPAAPRASVP